METIMQAINESWHWLGPWQVVCWGTAVALLIKDIFNSAIKDIRNWQA